MYRVKRWESALAAASQVAEWLESAVFVVNVSGGKDSTAAALLMRENGVPHRRVFADTGWEAQETYEHLERLRVALGPIDVVGAGGRGRADAD